MIEVIVTFSGQTEPDTFTVENLPLLRKIVKRVEEHRYAEMRSERVFSAEHLPDLQMVIRALTATVPAEPQGVAVPLGARLTDPSTSHNAAPSRERYKQLEAAILAALADHGDGTEEEVASWCDVPRTSISPCFRPMIRANLLMDVTNADGTKMKRKNSAGKMALVRAIFPRNMSISGLEVPPHEEEAGTKA
jgi:hypothetical protein